MSVLTRLLRISLRACECMQPLLVALYNSQSNTATLKSDDSILTLADGIVQHLVLDVLFKNKFNSKVGEEYESRINLSTMPYYLNDIQIPTEFITIIDETKRAIEVIATEVSTADCAKYALFLDPIDGTREFSTGYGEQSSTLIGIADAATGASVAGLIYRPISSPPTWAMGVPDESFCDSNALPWTPPTHMNSFLTTNSGISSFISQLNDELRQPRIKAGGAGNKLLLLVEGKGACYIQDRGVSRWDTCAGSAILRAHGGVFFKLSSVIEHTDASKWEDYVYKPTETNLDVANLPKDPEIDVSKIAPYANICGLFALPPGEAHRMEEYGNCVRAVARRCSPKYL